MKRTASKITTVILFVFFILFLTVRSPLFHAPSAQGKSCFPGWNNTQSIWKVMFTSMLGIIVTRVNMQCLFKENRSCSPREFFIGLNIYNPTGYTTLLFWGEHSFLEVTASIKDFPGEAWYTQQGRDSDWKQLNVNVLILYQLWCVLSSRGFCYVLPWNEKKADL